MATEHNNLPEFEIPQNSNDAMIIIRPSIQQYTFDNFRTFVNANMHLVVTDEPMHQPTFRRLLLDFPPESEGFDILIARIRAGQNIDAASDGSRLDDGRASAGWLLWTMKKDNQRDDQQ